MKIRSFPVKCLFGFWTLLILIGCSTPQQKDEDVFSFAQKHLDDLRFSVYITAHTIERLFPEESARREALSLLRANGITKVYLEVYRSGLVVSTELLTDVSEFFENNGFEVVGGIATVPGRGFGVKQEGKLGWFNWQNKKTQDELREVMLNVAPIFDTFIVDDFLCTGDTSTESRTAKGDRTWPDYRRALMTEVASSVFIKPAKSVNPDITMIIKYPQWYDRFHMFGYDVESGPELFDQVWVGTETRGQYTQRFGFVQPYEGFVNYRWISDLSGDKIGGAWFDHGDCDALDFVEQAYQTVLAGASEIVFFNYNSYFNGHPGHHQVRMDMEKLYALANAVKSNPVKGIAGYKPPHSDAGGDLYVMDFMGMLGIPLMPVTNYPENAKTVFLPTQAAQDPEIVEKALSSIDKGARIIATSGFMAKVNDDGRLSEIAGVTRPLIQSRQSGSLVLASQSTAIEPPLDLGTSLELVSATPTLIAESDKGLIPYFTSNEEGNFFVLNSHTFSEADFEAVGEVLLCPRPLGMLEIPEAWAGEIRSVFNDDLPLHLEAPTRVTMQPLGDDEVVIHNYNKEKTTVRLTGLDGNNYEDLFSGQKYAVSSEGLEIEIGPRSRIWLKQSK